MVEFKEMDLVEGVPKIIKANSICQSDLTCECWGVQAWGLEHCETCEYKDTEDCGGQEIREAGKNSKGLEVPLGFYTKGGR